jgi:hypothetical protein
MTSNASIGKPIAGPSGVRVCAEHADRSRRGAMRSLLLSALARTVRARPRCAEHPNTACRDWRGHYGALQIAVAAQMHAALLHGPHHRRNIPFVEQYRKSGVLLVYSLSRRPAFLPFLYAPGCLTDLLHVRALHLTGGVMRSDLFQRSKTSPRPYVWLRRPIDAGRAFRFRGRGGRLFFIAHVPTV